MEVVDNLSCCPHPPSGTVVTIGAYDGVHLGHRKLIERVRELADARGCASAVVTFDRHPAQVVRPDSAPRLITDLPTKLARLAETGLDYAVVVHFDAERAHEPAEDFVRTVLVGCLTAKVIVVGHDFHFGHNRGGNVDLLRRMGPELGFEVLGIELFDDQAGEGPVSSTRIRTLLAAGAVDAAAALLGRPHRLTGPVIHGDKRGRELGFPTANVAVGGEFCLPADGIYAGWLIRADGARLPAAVSLGRRPTFYADATASLLECHVLDFDGDLYDEEVGVEFVARLRPELRFDGPDALERLVAQMHTDVNDARRLLAAS